MSFDEKGWPVFPVRNGGSVGKGVENQMLDAVGGPNTIRTRVRTLPDGSTVMLRTRAGMPEFTMTPKKEIAKSIELIFYCRFIDKYRPLGVANNGECNASYTIPTKPVSKGAIVGTVLSAEADTTIGDTPGPMRWVDSRTTPVVKETLTWASVIGQGRPVQTATFSPYISPYCHDDNVQTRTVSTPYGNVATYTAGQAFPGQQFTTAPSNAYVGTEHGARMRFTGINGLSPTLFVDGVTSGISEKIASAAIGTLPDKHIKVLVMSSYGSAGWDTVCAMRIKHYTMDGAAHPILADVAVTLPEGVGPITCVQHGPAFNSSATKFVLGAIVAKTGYTVPLSSAEVELKVFEGDASTGVLTEVVMPFSSTVTTTSSPPDYRLYTETNALNDTWTSTRIDVTYGLIGSGYSGDELQLLIHKWEGNNTSEKVIALHSTSIPAGQTVTENRVTTSSTYTYTNSVLLYPDNTVLHSSSISGSSTNDRLEEITYGYTPSWSHVSTTHTETTTISGVSAANAATADIYAAFADFGAGVFCFATNSLVEASTAIDPSIYTKTGSMEYASAPYPGYSITTTRDGKIVFADRNGQKSLTALTSCEDSTTSYAASAGGSAMPAYSWVRYLLNTASYSTETEGFAVNGTNGDFHCFDGFSFAVDQDGTTCVISALHGNSFDSLTYDPYDEYGSYPFEMLATTNLVGRKVVGAWAFSTLSLPTYLDTHAWMAEPTFIKVTK